MSGEVAGIGADVGVGVGARSGFLESGALVLVLVGVLVGVGGLGSGNSSLKELLSFSSGPSVWLLSLSLLPESESLSDRVKSGNAKVGTLCCGNEKENGAERKGTGVETEDVGEIAVREVTEETEENDCGMGGGVVYVFAKVQLPCLSEL
jgi:hypothetical protein